jgi:hypothetical protein
VEKGIKLGLVLSAPDAEKHSIYNASSATSSDEEDDDA